MKLTPDFTTIRLANSNNITGRKQGKDLFIEYIYISQSGQLSLNFGCIKPRSSGYSIWDWQELIPTFLSEWQSLLKAVYLEIEHLNYHLLYIQVPTYLPTKELIETLLSEIFNLCDNQIPGLMNSTVNGRNLGGLQLTLNQNNYEKLDIDYRPNEILPEDFYS
jgi:hypothetical protein